MNRYEVVSECYVPLGSRFRYRRPGQIVTLSDVDASLIAEHIRPVEESEREQDPVQEKSKPKRVAKRNTQPEAAEQPVDVEQPEAVGQPVEVEQPAVEEVAEGVISDGGYPQAGHE